MTVTTSSALNGRGSACSPPWMRRLDVAIFELHWFEKHYDCCIVLFSLAKYTGVERRWVIHRCNDIWTLTTRFLRMAALLNPPSIWCFSCVVACRSLSSLTGKTVASGGAGDMLLSLIDINPLHIVSTAAIGLTSLCFLRMLLLNQFSCHSHENPLFVTCCQQDARADFVWAACL